MRHHRIVLIACFSFAAWILVAGCGSPGPVRPFVLETSIGPRLEALLDAHGGWASWRERAGVEFVYRARFATGREVTLPVTLFFDEPDRVWLRPAVSTDEGQVTWTAFDLRATEGALARGVFRDASPSPAMEAHDATFDFLLRSLRDLFELPFAAVSTGWEIQVPVIASPLWEHRLPDELALAPRRSPLLVGPYLVPLPSESHGSGGRIERAFYASCHPSLSGAVLEVEFRRYATIDGLEIATERAHFLPLRPADVIASQDPLEWAPETTERKPLFVETLESIRFLDREEVARLRGEDENA
ncbi:MAG TPA: hypothetical protein VK116_17645 [Planctomycetota bacterium]|nr:hypothetical protein [Planctomycetota bacterium]